MEILSCLSFLQIRPTLGLPLDSPCLGVNVVLVTLVLGQRYLGKSLNQRQTISVLCQENTIYNTIQ